MNNQKETKICIKCKVEKNKNEFYKRKDNGYYKSECSECTKILMKEYRQINKEKIRITNKKYIEKNIEKVSEYRKDYGKKYYIENKELLLEKNKEKYIKDKENILARNKQYRIDNFERISIKAKEYREENRDYLLYLQREYYKNNKEKRKEYLEKNKEKIKNYRKQYSQTDTYKASLKNSKYKRRALEKNGDVTSAQICELQKNAKTCYWCNTSLKNKKINIDHYVPLSKGGLHSISNLVVSCRKCNLTKNAKDPYQFALSVGKLF